MVKGNISVWNKELREKNNRKTLEKIWKAGWNILNDNQREILFVLFHFNEKRVLHFLFNLNLKETD